MTFKRGDEGGHVRAQFEMDLPPLWNIHVCHIHSRPAPSDMLNTQLGKVLKHLAASESFLLFAPPSFSSLEWDLLLFSPPYTHTHTYVYRPGEDYDGIFERHPDCFCCPSPMSGPTRLGMHSLSSNAKLPSEIKLFIRYTTSKKRKETGI